MNKERVVRGYLDIENAKMVNERMLPTYASTGLYFVMAGWTMWKLMQLPQVICISLVITGAIIALTGFRKKPEEHRGNIDKFAELFIKYYSRYHP